MAEEGAKAGNLAGRAREHHFPTLLQQLLRLAVGVADAALHILAAHHGIHLFKAPGGDMMHFPCPVIYGSEHHAAPLDYFPCQGKEHASRGAVHALPLVAVLRRIYVERRSLFLRTENWAYLLAQSALGAHALVYPGIEKPLAVLTQGDAMLWATLHACGATAAFTPPLK